MSSMDLGREDSRMSFTDVASNEHPQHPQQQHVHFSDPNASHQQHVNNAPPPNFESLDPASLPPELLSALQQLDPERQVRAMEMLLAEQLERQQQGGVAEESGGQRVEEHFLTIALNGTILGATEMATGFHPGSLLMTSA